MKGVDDCFPNAVYIRVKLQCIRSSQETIYQKSTKKKTVKREIWLQLFHSIFA